MASPSKDGQSRVKRNKGGATGVASTSATRQPKRASGDNGAAHKQTPANAKDDVQDVESSERSGSDEEAEEAVLDRSKLLLASHPMPPVDGLVRALRQFKNLQKLDVSDMKPSEENGNPYGLDSLAWLSKAAAPSKDGDAKDTFGTRLTWFKCSDNANLGKRAGKAVWTGLDRLTNLTVLNASSCALTLAPPAPTLIAWPSLAALILGHNEISELTHFPHMPALNTLVLSHNAITSLASDLPANLPALKKISITHNKLAWRGDVSPLPDFSACSHLREVRISGNSLLARLPTHLQTWGRGIGKDRKGTGLEIFEAGDCGLADWDAIAPLLPQAKATADEDAKEDMVHPSRRRVRGLSTLYLRGNEVSRLPEYRERILALHTGLRVLDSEKVGRGIAAPPPPVALEPPLQKVERNADDVAKPRPPPEGKVSKKAERQQAEVSKRERKTAAHDESIVVKRKTQPATPKDKEREQLHHDQAAKKERKRGSRGKAKSGQSSKVAEEKGPAIRDPFLQSAASHDGDDRLARSKARAGPPTDGKKRGKAAKKASSDDVDLARIRARAGPSMASVGAKKKRDTSSDKHAAAQPSKKRKAWDEDDAIATKKSKVSPPTAPLPTSVPPTKKKEAPATKEQTSVAGVVEVKPNKKRSGKSSEAAAADDKTQSVWAQVKQTKDLSLGVGGAWD